MKRKGYLFFVFLFTLFITENNITSQEALEISVQADKSGAEIQPTMWGVFFEDINFAADGGIYTELVKNRSFEFELPMTGWRTLSKQNGTGRMVANFYFPSRPSNPHFMRIYIDPSAATYAPLLAHVDAWQWRPDLIWFDNLTTIGTPNYYVQKFFSNYKGTTVVPVLSGGKTLTGQDGVYASGSIDRKGGQLYVKLVNSTSQIKPVAISLGPLPYVKIAVKETLRSGSKDDFNSITNPKLIYPVSTPVKIAGRKINAEADPLSISVFIIDFKTR